MNASFHNIDAEQHPILDHYVTLASATPEHNKNYAKLNVWLFVLALIGAFLFSTGPVNAESIMPPSVKLAKASTKDAGDKKQEKLASVNINEATAEELAAALKGVGSKKAKAIVEYRENYGAFETIDELADVKGIGPATIKKNEGAILLK